MPQRRQGIFQFSLSPFIISLTYPFSGRIPLLLPPPLPRKNSRLPLLRRRYPAPPPNLRTPPTKCLPSPLPPPTTPTSQKPRPIQTRRKRRPSRNRRSRQRSRYPFSRPCHPLPDPPHRRLLHPSKRKDSQSFAWRSKSHPMRTWRTSCRPRSSYQSRSR